MNFISKVDVDVEHGWPVEDCVYCIDEEGQFWITPKPYWELNKCCHDCFDNVVGLPRGFENTQESAWDYYGKQELGIAALEKAGAVFSQEMHDEFNK